VSIPALGRPEPAGANAVSVGPGESALSIGAGWRVSKLDGYWRLALREGVARPFACDR